MNDRNEEQRADAHAHEARRLALEAELGEPITVDGLTQLPGRRWILFQRRKGHRHSTDDLLTAFYALEKTAAARPARALDLGTGIGSVGMLVLSGLPDDAALTCIEAQDISYRFLRENLRANGIADRVRALHGDLRDLALGERFPLITGSPPYFDPGAGIVPADSQKAHARFELRGDVRDYARTALKHLEPDGLFVFCFPWPQRERALAAVQAEGLFVRTQRDVVPRAGIPPLFSLFCCSPDTSAEDANARAFTYEPPFVVRDAAGEHTQAMHDLRASFGWPPGR